MPLRRFTASALLALSTLLVPLAATVAAKPAPRSTAQASASSLTTYIFVSPDCPIAAKYGPRVAELAHDFAGKGVRFVVVYSGGDPAFTANDLRRWSDERGMNAVAVQRDLDASLARRLHATTTPEAVVTSASGALAYIGRVDDNVNRDRVIHQDTRLALSALVAGKPVPTPRTRAFGCAIVFAASATSSPVSLGNGPTYSHDVAPILNRNCVSCHRAGDVGPFALDSYAQARLWASAVKQYTASRKMPPYKADPHFGGPFADARVLSETEIQTIARWADSGAPIGDPKQLPEPPRRNNGEWTLGTPDAVLQPSQAFHVGAEGSDTYRDFAIGPPFAQDTLVKSMEFRAGDPSIVHHMIAFIDRSGDTCTAKEGKSADGQPGWLVSGADSGVKDGEWGSGWAPGMVPAPLPQGVALLIPKGARLVLQVHYHKSGKPETDLSRVALYYARPDETIEHHIHVATLGNPLLDLKPNVARNLVSADMLLPYDATLYQIIPHMHLLGKEMTVTARTPSGTVIPLIRVRDWEFQWQSAYRYETPIHLPKGTRLMLRAVFDNTVDNPNQPFQPPHEIKFGEQTTDEMCFAFLGLTRDTPAIPATAAR